MDIKDYIKVLRRHGISMAAVFTVVVCAFFATQHLARPQLHQADATLFFKGIWDEAAEGKWFAPIDTDARVSLMRGLPVLTQLREALEREGAAVSEEELTASLGIEVLKNANNIRVSGTSRDPEFALRLRDRYLQIYKEYEINQTLDKIRGRLAELQKLEEGLAKAMEAQNAAYSEGLRQIFAEHGIVDISIQGVVTERMLVSFEGEMQNALVNIRRLEYQTERLRNRQQVIRRLMATVSMARILFPGLALRPVPPQADPELAKEMEHLHRTLEGQLIRWTESHPEVIRHRERILDLRARLGRSEGEYPGQVIQGLEEKRNQEEAAVTMFNEILGREYDRLKAINRSRDKVAGWKRAVEQIEKRTGQVQEERYALDRQLAADRRIMEQAIVVLAQSKGARPLPTNRMAPGLILLVGLILAGASGMLVELLRTGMYTAHDVNAHMNLQVIGSVPALRKEEDRILTKAATKSPLAELFARIALPLAAAAQERQAKFILVTSARDGEGKSTTSANLGISLAQSGYRVILVDGDMRRGSLHRIFGTEKSPGLSQILQGELAARQKLDEAMNQQSGSGREATWQIGPYLQPSLLPNLFLLPSGTNPSNPVHCLNATYLQPALQLMSDLADFVIVDSPPVLSVVDPGILARACHLVVIVVGEGMTSKADAMLIKRSLKHVGEKVWGVVMNKVSDSSSEGYYYYYDSELTKGKVTKG